MLRPRSSSLPPAPADGEVLDEGDRESSPEGSTPPPALLADADFVTATPSPVEVTETPAPVEVSAPIVEAAPETPPPALIEVAPAPNEGKAREPIAEAKLPEPEPFEVTSAPPPAVAAAPNPSQPQAQQGQGKKKKKKKHHDGRASAAPPSTTLPSAPAVSLQTPKASEPARAADASKASDLPRVVEIAKASDPPKASGTSSPSHKLLTSSGKPADDDTDLSISHKFFVDGESMPPPLVHEAEHETEKVAPPTKEALAHRARLKRIVGGVVAAASLFAVIGIVRMALTSKPANAMPTNSAQNVGADAKLLDTKKKDTAPAPATATALATAVATADASANATPSASAASADSAAPSASDSAAPADSAKADEPKKDASNLSAAEVKDLKMKAAITANGGDMNKAIEAAKSAIDADPTDAMSYMYLYNDYSQIGKMKDAGEALNECVRAATSADKWQCAQWGGHK